MVVSSDEWLEMRLCPQGRLDVVGLRVYTARHDNGHVLKRQPNNAGDPLGTIDLYETAACSDGSERFGKTRHVVFDVRRPALNGYVSVPRIARDVVWA